MHSLICCSLLQSTANYEMHPPLLHAKEGGYHALPTTAVILGIDYPDHCICPKDEAHPPPTSARRRIPISRVRRGTTTARDVVVVRDEIVEYPRLLREQGSVRKDDLSFSTHTPAIYFV